MATPVKFALANREMAFYGDDSEQLTPIPHFTDGGQCVSRWRLTWRERLQALFLGHVWLSLRCGEAQPAASISADPEYVRLRDEPQPAYERTLS